MDSGIEYLMGGWKARAEAAEAENTRLRAELQFIIDATEDDCETAWIASVARLALGGEHE